jgi:hypothetical protein
VADLAGSPAFLSAGRSGDAPRVSAPVRCQRAVRFYRAKIREHAARMGHVAMFKTKRHGCYLAHVLQRKARAWRLRAERYVEFHYHWWKWLPDKWQRIGACETGYGRRPGDWRWNSGTYQGAFGFYHGSWDTFALRADRKAGPYPSEAYLATPRQQYEVALAIWRAYGFSGWGCRGA